MPIREYECERCRKVFEVLERTQKQDRKPVCPACGGKSTQPIFSSFAGRATASGGCSPAPGGG
jgi:putative FmdB family regulatory protein